jgi:GntR family transcriptional regulator/MocR family aminotransferase
MKKRYAAALLGTLALDRTSGEPLYRQLYFAIREAILEGRLRPGTRLPSTRSLAADLDVSRNTVVIAFDQLLAEGYVEGRTGAGTYVSATLPEELLTARPGRVVPRDGARHAHNRLSERGRFLAGIRTMSFSEPAPFSPALPELARFPFDDWARLLAKHWRYPKHEFLVGGDAAGYAPLRAAIAAYLGAARAVTCDADQVMIVSGAQPALDLATRVLIDPGDEVWIEDPGYAGIRGALIASGAALAPVPLDGEGLDVTAGRRRAPAARLAIVTPSHQYPLGVTMSLTRRLELLDWARSADAFVIEDDYDSEYRYAGRPLAALQGLDGDGRVIYIGTFSKVMFPGLRLGYLVVPADLVDAFRGVRQIVDSHPSSVAQAALADFIAEGYLAAHVRRMRALYAERQAALLTELRKRLGGRLTVAPDESGMHLIGYLDDAVDDAALSQAAAARGVVVSALSRLYVDAPPRKGLMLGYAGVAEPAMRRAVATLAGVFDDFFAARVDSHSAPRMALEGSHFSA